VKDVYIGLGSNLAHPLQQVLKAQQSLSELPESDLLASSKYYQTPPLGGLDQPHYINAVCHLRSQLSAFELLEHLQQIERQQGRQQGQHQGEPKAARWQSRPLDLDILLYGDEIITAPGLVVPHYAMTERNFVIFPLLELTPDIVIPGVGRAAWVAGKLSREGLVEIAGSE